MDGRQTPQGQLKMNVRSQHSDQSLELIYGFFHPGQIHRAAPEGAPLIYKAVQYLCEEERISIESFDNVVRLTGGACGIEDIGRISHFPVRKITLESGWRHKDGGSFLAFLKTGTSKEPVPCVCYQDSLGRYRIYDPLEGHSVRVGRSHEERIAATAWMVYRPFPAKPMSFRDLMRFALDSRKNRDIVTFVLTSFLVMLVSQMLPMLTRLIYDVHLPLSEPGPIYLICLVLVVANLGSLCFSVVKSLAGFRIYERMCNSIQTAVFERLFNMKTEEIQAFETADLGNRALGVTKVFDLVQSIVINAVFTVILSIVYLIPMYRYSPAMTGRCVLILLAGAAIQIPLLRRQGKYARAGIELSAEADSTVFQMINGVMRLKLSGAEQRAEYRYFETRTRALMPGVKEARLGYVANALSSVFSAIATIAVFCMIGYGRESISIGSYVGFSTAFGLLSGSLYSMLGAFSQADKIRPLMQRIRPILEAAPEYESGQSLPEELTGEIEMCHVSFSYEKDGGRILNDLSLHIKPGEYVGIVGASGCGKSTLIKLLLGFEEPDNGQIYYGDYKMSTLNKCELRRHLGVVLQNGTVFTGSIADNIRICAPNASYEDLKAVIRMVGLEKDIRMMPMGVHTHLSEGGNTISGGQQQRLLLARALIAKPKILILDEATSALDNVTQRHVQEQMDQLDVTRIVVAHRLSTIVNCDRIVVLQDGRIAQEGTYRELMEEDGLFRQMAERQIV